MSKTINAATCAICAICAICVLWAVPGLAAEAAADSAAEKVEGGATEGYCYAVANCLYGQQVSCEGDAVCSSSDENCPTTRGSVQCDGVTTYCPSYCPIICPMRDKPCKTHDDCKVFGDPECEFCMCDFGGICLCPE